MRRKSGLSEISSEKNSRTSTEDFSIYDVPGANLSARAEAYTLLKHSDEAVQTSAQRIIDLLTSSIRAMGREDMALLNIETAAPSADAA